MRNWVRFWACVVFFSAYVAASAAVSRYVNRTNLNPSPPYQTPVTAATNIQDAIAVANDGDTVIVQAGVYYENISFLGKTMAVSSDGGPLVTIIDGSHSNSVVTFAGGEGANMMLNGFTITNGYALRGGGIYCTNASPVITNCIITGSSTLAGTNNGSGGPFPIGLAGNGGDGGGIYASANSSPMIAGCIISNNATGPGGLGTYCGGGGNGGGIFCYSATVITSVIADNRTGAGGGQYPAVPETGGRGGDGGGVYCSSATIRECLIQRNTTGIGGFAFDSGGQGGRGGGLFSLASSRVESCVISQNRTERGQTGYKIGPAPVDGGQGGGIYAAGGSPDFRSCSVLGNVTGEGSWGDYIGGGGGDGAGLYAAALCSPVVSSCTFMTNTTGNGGRAGNSVGDAAWGGVGGRGGGAFCYTGTFSNCIFKGNRTGDGGSAQSDGAPPAGGSGGDGAGFYTAAAAVITSCLLANNSTGRGGDGHTNSSFGGYAKGGNGGSGSGCWSAGGTIANCTIWGNMLGGGGGIDPAPAIPGTNGIGGGVWCTNGVVMNTILWADDGIEIVGSNFLVTHSDVRSGTGQPWFDPANCLDADPQLVNAAAGDFHLTMFSPCINAGLNQPWMSGAVDLDGGPRIMQGIVDMGAYEYAHGFLAISRTAVQSSTNPSGTNFWLQASGTPGASCVLQASTDLMNWVTLANVGVGTNGLWEFIDRDMRSYPRRFYRATQWPPGTVYFSAPSGEITPPFVPSGDYIYQQTETGIADGGRAAYNFTVSNAGTYVIEAMVNAPNASANSFFVNIDAEPQDPAMVWDILPYTAGFEERLVSWRGSGTFDNNEFTPKVFALAPGAHQVIIRGREGHTCLQGMAIVPYPAVYIPITPETVTAPFIITNNYLYQPVETGVTNGGRAVYSFAITNAGSFVIRAVVNATNASANSFFVNIDAEPQDPYMVWDIPLTSGFEQREVSWRGDGTFDTNQFVPKVFQLTQGSHQLIIRGREQKTLLRSMAVRQYP